MLTFTQLKRLKNQICHRPIGIGVQGLADTFAMLGFAFDSKEAKDLNKEIFAVIYLSDEASIDAAKKMGRMKPSRDRLF